MASGVQNVRSLRFLIVLGAVVLTIFVYASYYSSRSLALPHIRTGVPAPLTNALANNKHLKQNTLDTKNNLFPKNFKLAVNTSNLRLTSYSKHAGQDYLNSIPVKQHREPTIDVEAPVEVDNDVEAAFEERDSKDQQYQQLSEINLGNSSSFVQSPQPPEQVEININKIPDSDVLIPTSNLQKFIENADKILKNMTASSLTGQSIDKEISAEKKTKPNADVFKKAKSSAVMPLSKGLNSVPPALALDSKNSSIGGSSSSINMNATTTATKNVASVDPTQGIPTKQIYESGHLDDEINIPQICPDEGSDIKLLILITSALSHYDARLAIRQTWAHYGARRDVATLFILGRTTNETLSNALSQENFLYGDLIRGQFVDSYNNLTLKTISALEWVDRHCARAKFILKTDDDMFINVAKLLAFLDRHTQEKRVIYGRLAKKWKPIRNKKSKYYVSPGQFAAPIFPPFTTGPAYVMSADTIHDLYERSLHQTYFKLEDVFTTGIVAQQLGIKRIHVNEFLNRRIAFNPCNIRKTISVHMIKSNEQFDLWKKLLDQTTKCK